MMYWVCPYCGAHLDVGEKCDCKKYDCNGGALRRFNKINYKGEKNNGNG